MKLIVILFSLIALVVCDENDSSITLGDYYESIRSHLYVGRSEDADTTDKREACIKGKLNFAVNRDKILKTLSWNTASLAADYLCSEKTLELFHKDDVGEFEHILKTTLDFDASTKAKFLNCHKKILQQYDPANELVKNIDKSVINEEECDQSNQPFERLYNNQILKKLNLGACMKDVVADGMISRSTLNVLALTEPRDEAALAVLREKYVNRNKPQAEKTLECILKSVN